MSYFSCFVKCLSQLAVGKAIYIPDAASTNVFAVFFCSYLFYITLPLSDHNRTTYLLTGMLADCGGLTPDLGRRLRFGPAHNE